MKSFSTYLLYVILVLGLCAGGIYLIEKEHYGWAWIPFVIATCVKFKSTEKNDTSAYTR